MKCILLSLLWILACTDAQPKQTDTASVATNTDPTSCFEKYAGKLDELLTRDDIISVYSTDIENAQKNYLRAVPAAYQACIYEWESNRTRTIKVTGREMTIPSPNRIGVANLSFYGEKIKDPLAYFKNAHRTPTEEEKTYMQQEMTKKLEEEELSAPQKETGTKLTTSVMDKIQFEAVEGIGDAAAWDFMDSALVVLTGRTKFKIIVDISDAKEENLAIAKKLAILVLKKCS